MGIAEKITLFWFFLQGVCCTNFNISLPEKIQALSGSCVIIKCRFEIIEKYEKDLNEKAAGVWFKDGTDVNKNLVFNSSSSLQISHIMGEIMGELKDKNCSTVFNDVRLNHTGQYIFRIEGTGKLKYTYNASNVSVDVIESPVKPQVQLYVEQKELQDELEVLEGRSVSLRCSAEALCSSPPATFTWSSTTEILLSESSKQQELIISNLNFTAARHHHNVTFTCSISYQLKDNNKTANSSITLHVQYAPQFSPSSSCYRTDVTVIRCFCEVYGNPFPEVQWLLSGRPVSNSSDTFISEERLNSTGLRTFISLHQSLANTSSLMCFSRNIHGNERVLFQLVFVTEKECRNPVFVLTGIAVVALVIALLCAVIYIQTNNGKLLQTTQEGGTWISGQYADQENEGDGVYVTMTFAGAAKQFTRQKSIISSSTNFTESNPSSQKVEGVSSCHAEYAVVRRSTKDSRKIPKKIDVVTEQTESMESEEEHLVDSSPIYAKVPVRSTKKPSASM